MEHLFDLLQEGLPIELGCRNEGVLPEKDVLATQCRIEVLVEEVEGAFVTSLKDDLDGVLQVDRHFVRLEVVLCALAEPILRALVLAFQTEEASSGGC